MPWAVARQAIDAQTSTRQANSGVSSLGNLSGPVIPSLVLRGVSTTAVGLAVLNHRTRHGWRMRDLERDLRRFDGLALRRDLLDLGHGPAALRAAQAAGRVAVPRRGWLANDLAPATALRAVRLGGRLGAASALESYGIWVDGDTLTVATASTASRLPALSSTERRIWGPDRFPEKTSRRWRVSVCDALLQHARLVDRDSLIASIDSALYLHLLRPAQLGDLMRALPGRLTTIRTEVDGRAMSGTESKLRVALRRAGLRVEPQVSIPNVGIVDLLVDDWLIVEVDSRRYHEPAIQQHKDRVRDGNAVLGDFGFLRFDYALVQFERQWCVDVVLARLSSGRP
jgi:hypothetical protein